jgi:SAM-dependent methyltransferase
LSKILAVDVIEHIPDDQGALYQMARALQPGGRIVITTLVANRPSYTFRLVFDDHVREYDADSLVSLVQQSGLEVRDVFGFYYAPRMIAREIQAVAEKIPLGDWGGVKALAVGTKLFTGFLCRLMGDLERLFPIRNPAGIGILAVKPIPGCPQGSTAATLAPERLQGMPVVKG